MIIDLDLWRRGWLMQFPKHDRLGPRSVFVEGRAYFFVAPSEIGDALFASMFAASEQGYSPRAVIAVDASVGDRWQFDGVGYPYYLDAGGSFLKIERQGVVCRSVRGSWRKLLGVRPTTRAIGVADCLECQFSVDPCSVHVYRL